MDCAKQIVLVTQGTVANRDFGELIRPTLAALGERKDLIVLATTDGKPVESILCEIPANVRVAEFLPFDLILPHVDLLITNGGYGTVNMAQERGIPIISAGLTEDKEEVSAHVQWAGVGIDLHTNHPTSSAISSAVSDVIENAQYRNQAKVFAKEFGERETERELLQWVEACASKMIDA